MAGVTVLVFLEDFINKLFKMKIQRVIFLCCLIALVSAGLFGDDPKLERKKKRQEEKLNRKADKRSQKQKNGPAKDDVL